MRLFEREAAGIYRLRVPFENLTTSVFLLLTQEGPVLYDCATTSEDVKTVILPALAELRIAPQDLRGLVVSHAHADHSGGLATLQEHAPQVPVITAHTAAEAEVLFGSLRALHLPGHTADCLGLYELNTDTLLTADALQLMGIGRFGCSLAAPEDYVQTIEKIRRLAPCRILTAHAYVPYGNRAEGAAEIARCACGNQGVCCGAAAPGGGGNHGSFPRAASALAAAAQNNGQAFAEVKIKNPRPGGRILREQFIQQ